MSERAQLEQLRLPGHLLLPDVMNLRGKNLIFSFLRFEASPEPSPRESPVTGPSCDRVPHFLLQRSCARSGEEGVCLPSKILLPRGCASSKLTVTAQTLPLGSSQKSAGRSCRGSLEHSEEHWAVSASPSHAVSLQLFKTPLKTSSSNRQAGCLSNTVLTTATQSLSILHSLLGQKEINKSLIKALLHK